MKKEKFMIKVARETLYIMKFFIMSLLIYVAAILVFQKNLLAAICTIAAAYTIYRMIFPKGFIND